MPINNSKLWIDDLKSLYLAPNPLCLLVSGLLNIHEDRFVDEHYFQEGC